MLDFGFYNMDCMEGMREFPDKFFDLAIVDPPYGGGAAPQSADDLTDTSLRGGAGDWEQKARSRVGGRFDKYKIDSQPIAAARTGAGHNKYDAKVSHWDIAPTMEYFNELARISKNQIIWGGNYFDLPPTRSFIVWRKTNIPASGFSMAPVEYAWTSFNANAGIFDCGSSGGAGKEDRFHPTQKPIALYKWILGNYGARGDKILDTHVGSASSLIACEEMGFPYVGFEIDADYYKAACARMEKAREQQSLFTPEQIYAEQLTLGGD